jgi:hypothetical protein
LNDSADRMDAEELAEAACGNIRSALAALDGLRRALRGEPVLSHQDRLNVVRFVTRPTRPSRKRAVEP